MRALAVLTPNTDSSWRRSPVYRATMHDRRVAFAFVEQPDVDFVAADPVHATSALVRIEAFSCNYREKARFLHTARRLNDRGYVVIGSEFAGTVVKVGSAVGDLRPGDRVCGNGCIELDAAHAGLTSQRASAELQIFHCRKLFRLPESMSTVEGAAFSIGAQTAYSMVSRLNVETDTNVAVTAASSNTALFAIKALLARGHRVHALTTSASIVPHLSRLGVRGICQLPRDRDPASILRQYLEQQHINAFDAIIDPFHDVYLPKLLPLLRRFGLYITCGLYRQFPESPSDAFIDYGLAPYEVASLLVRKSISLLGNNLGTTAHLEQAANDFRSGRLTVDIDTVVTGDAIETLIERTFGASDRIGKVVYQY